MHLERVRGNKITFLKDTGGPIIVEFKDGQVFGGDVDDYETGVFWLYNCMRLNKKKHEWQNHGIMTEFEGKKN